MRANALRAREEDIVLLDGITNNLINQTSDQEMLLNAAPVVPVCLVPSSPLHSISIWERSQSLEPDSSARIYHWCTQEEQLQAVLEHGAQHIFLQLDQSAWLTPQRRKLIADTMLAEHDRARHKALRKLLPLMTGAYEHLLRYVQVNPTSHLYVVLADLPITDVLPRLPELETRMEALQRWDDGSPETDVSDELNRLMQQFNRIKEWHQWMQAGEPYLHRLANAIPEWTDLQAEALFRALLRVRQEGKEVTITVMLPYAASTPLGWGEKLAWIRMAAEQVLGQDNCTLPPVGAWIRPEDVGTDALHDVMNEVSAADMICYV
ncbi:hypothetical protein [Paenibacillus sp. 481]|uniref:hypothetical protein n=1 Tax=Paenibacillus sp. 481 TaxID=2835869 RepID=UPI001E45EEF9|nr:hypothetical protein [Paenibacillus sp. 481]UHA74540.1 hypothetical protein KIK04_05415 [Paenibacillus sp. 481]